MDSTRTQCISCHCEKAKQQKNAKHLAMNLPCVECHMPKIIMAAWGDPAKFTADIRTHRMAIDPSLIEQAYSAQAADGNDVTYANSQVSLNSACRHCHVPDSPFAMDDATLIEAATDHHSPPVTL